MNTLYQRLLGPAGANLSEPVKRFHFRTASTMCGKGFFDIQYGKRRIARSLAKMLRLPPEGLHVPVHLKIIAHDGGERWERLFGSRFFVTEQREQSGEFLAEKVNLLELWFRLVIDNRRLFFHQEKAVLRFGPFVFPFPKSLAPLVNASCWSEGSERGMRVIVQVTVPLLGDLLKYEGYIEEGADRLTNDGQFRP